MRTVSIIPYSVNNLKSVTSDFEEAFYHSQLVYSLNQLKFIGSASEEKTLEVLHQALVICQMLGINSRHHFKKIYVFDSTQNTIIIDWLMSKSGINLMVMQTQDLTKHRAAWLWELAKR